MKKIAIAFIGLLMLSGCGEVIDSGHRGVKISLGKVEEKPLIEGAYFYNPFGSTIKEIDIRVKKIEKETSSYTKDVQTAHINYVVNASLDPNKVAILYREVGIGSDGIDEQDFQSKVLVPIIEGELKAVIGNWTATDLIANRDKATVQVEQKIKEKLAEKYVIVNNFQITGIAYAPEFEKAVESKVIAIQTAEEAKNNTVKIREEATQQVISAKAQAESMRIRATALSANKNLIEYEAVQVQKDAVAKWNGTLPTQMLGNAIPFIGLNSGTKQN